MGYLDSAATSCPLPHEALTSSHKSFTQASSPGRNRADEWEIPDA